MHFRRICSVLFAFLQAVIFPAVPVLILVLPFSISAPAQTYTVLHTFTGRKDGAYPFAGLTIDKDNNLYGTANAGGNINASCPPVNAGCGLVYELKPSRVGWNFHPLYVFHGGKDGEGPYGRVVLGPGGKGLYGTTVEGGDEQPCPSGCGLVFRLTQPSKCKTKTCTWKESILYRFHGNIDGLYPSGDLTFDTAGNIYGTTMQGGSFGPGTIYELTSAKPDWNENILWNFTGNNDGGNPSSGVTFDPAGHLYATAFQGGDQQSGGAVVELSYSQSAWNVNTFYDFSGSSGVFPVAGLLLDNAGNLIGACASGGPGKNGGTVYQLMPPGGDVSVLYNFSGGDESGPWAKLTMDAAGDLYGTTQGDPSTGNWGTVFKLTRSKNGPWTETIVHKFTGGMDGGYPLTNLVFDSKGNLYGTTNLGGTGYGVVFEITP